jgi:aspartate-semialdehyde dehydrogenase
MVIPEIIGAHFEVIEAQKQRLGTKKGLIAAKPNMLDTELCPRADTASFLRHQGGYGHYLPGDFRRRKNLRTFPEIIDNVIPFIQRRGGKSEKGTA